jgi:hypothetical protein
MSTKMPPSRPTPWHLLRFAAGVLLLIWLAFRAFQPLEPGEAWILAASFSIVGHLLIGVWVFLHKLRAVSPWHRTADGFAFLFLFAAAASTANTPLWCAFFAGLFAVAILKYRQCCEENLPEPLKDYAREKIRLEAPAVVLFALAALVTARLPETHPVYQGIQIALFISAALFAVYLILIRQIYRKL